MAASWWVLALAAASGAIRVDPTTQMIVDEEGRARFFHGVNAVEKVGEYLPSRGSWDPRNSLNERDAADLASWGLNVVRLGVMWPGTFPANASWVNATYLASVKSMIEMLHARGVWTLVDLHQDVLSPFVRVAARIPVARAAVRPRRRRGSSVAAAPRRMPFARAFVRGGAAGFRSRRRRGIPATAVRRLR